MNIPDIADLIRKKLPRGISPIWRYRMNHGEYEKKSYGNRDKKTTYAVIYRSNTAVGIMSDLLVFMLYTDYVLKRGMIPVIDRSSFPSFVYQQDDSGHEENGWESFFSQPAGVSLVDLADCKHVRYYDTENRFNQNLVLKEQGLVFLPYPTDEVLNYYHGIIEDRFKITPHLMERIDKMYTTLFGTKKNVLGVSIREGFAKYMEKGSNPPIGNFKQASPQKTKEIVKEKKEEFGAEYVYLSCETNETVKQYKELFKDKLIVMERIREDYDRLPDDYEKVKNRKSKKQLCEDYIVDMFLLSKCRFLVRSGTSGDTAALFLKNGKYEKTFLINENRYSQTEVAE